MQGHLNVKYGKVLYSFQDDSVWKKKGVSEKDAAIDSEQPSLRCKPINNKSS